MEESVNDVIWRLEKLHHRDGPCQDSRSSFFCNEAEQRAHRSPLPFSIQSTLTPPTSCCCIVLGCARIFPPKRSHLYPMTSLNTMMLQEARRLAFRPKTRTFQSKRDGQTLLRWTTILRISQHDDDTSWACFCCNSATGTIMLLLSSLTLFNKPLTNASEKEDCLNSLYS